MKGITKSQRADRIFKYFGDWFLNSNGNRAKAECMRRFIKAEELAADKEQKQAFINETEAKLVDLTMKMEEICT